MKYRLVVVNDNGGEEYKIGEFENEQELAQWAKENNGELAKAQSK